MVSNKFRGLGVSDLVYSSPPLASPAVDLTTRYLPITLVLIIPFFSFMLTTSFLLLLLQLLILALCLGFPLNSLCHNWDLFPFSKAFLHVALTKVYPYLKLRLLRKFFPMLTWLLAILAPLLLTRNPHSLFIVLMLLIPLHIGFLLVPWNILPSLVLILRMLSNKFVSLCMIRMKLVSSPLSVFFAIFRAHYPMVYLSNLPQLIAWSLILMLIEQTVLTLASLLLGSMFILVAIMSLGPLNANTWFLDPLLRLSTLGW